MRASTFLTAVWFSCVPALGAQTAEAQPAVESIRPKAEPAGDNVSPRAGVGVMLLGPDAWRSAFGPPDQPWPVLVRSVGLGQQPTAPSTTQNPWFLRFGYQPGWVHQGSGFVKGENAAGEPIDTLQSFKFEFGRQTDGSQDWHHAYRFPSYGMGIFGAGFGNDEELGSPLAVYGFLTLPLANLGERVDLSTDFGIGMAFGFVPFDPETNPFNRAIGSSATVYIDWGFYLRYLLSEKVDVAGGMSFTHFSNGRVREPNIGLNAFTPVSMVRYNFHEHRPVLVTRPPQQAFQPGWELDLVFGGGTKNISASTDNAMLLDTDRRNTFGVANVSTALLRHFHRYGKVGGGVDVAYDGSTDTRVDLAGGAPIESRAPVAKRLNVGVFGGYQHLFGRFIILLDVGYYVWRGRTDGRVPEFYQRLGFKFDLTESLFAGVNVRFFDFGKSDYIEWHAGYRFWWS